MQTHLPVLIYDGHCPFCRGQVARLQRLVGKRFKAESFQEKGVLERFPALTHDACMQEIKLVMGNGQILGGAHAIFFTLSLNPIFRPVRWLYYLPGIQQLMDWGYAQVAARRYNIKPGDCPSGTCHIGHPPPKN
jgi:predicted DCC family thiol-disulfide oxidoreductase YuxK